MECNTRSGLEEEGVFKGRGPSRFQGSMSSKFLEARSGLLVPDASNANYAAIGGRPPPVPCLAGAGSRGQYLGRASPQMA